MRPAARCDAARQLIARHGISERRACGLVRVTRKTFRREPTPDRNAVLRQRLCELAEQRRRFGSPRLHVMLRREVDCPGSSRHSSKTVTNSVQKSAK